jgi:hypothetical protein
LNIKKHLSILTLSCMVSAAFASVAHASGMYVYVDEQGVPHYALQQLDERYQLFVHDGPALSDDVKILAVTPENDGSMTPNLPNMGNYGTGMSLNGLRIAEPSKAILNKLLRSQALARYEPTIHKHARAYGVDPNLIKAVMAAESGFNAGAVSPKNAQGLMQVIPPTAARYGVTEAQLMNPERNIYAGVRYLADLSRMFKGRPELIIAAYNAGEGAVYKYKRTIPPYKETQNYVRTVLQYYSVYQPNSVVVSDSGIASTTKTTNRRSAQRVSMKVGGQLSKKVVQ